MYEKRIILGFLVMFAMAGIVSASVRPSYVEEFYGLEPVEWMAIIAISCAVFDNLVSYAYKKKKDSTIEYNPAYARATIIAIALMSLGILGMGVIELNLNAIMTAVIIGLGGDVGTKKAIRK